MCFYRYEKGFLGLGVLIKSYLICTFVAWGVGRGFGGLCILVIY